MSLIQIEPRHDFLQKLKQRGSLPALQRYLAWQMEVRRAEAAGLPPPVLKDWAPLSVNVDLTTSCNFACPHCTDITVLNTAKTHKYHELLESFENLVAGGLRSVILIGGGEPTLHPKFGEIVGFLKDRKVQIGIVSNGSRGDAIYDVADRFTLRDWIRFSLDSGDNKTFRGMHLPKNPKVTLEGICERVPKIRERNPALAVGFSFIIVWEGAKGEKGDALIPNIDEMVLAARLAKEHGFTYVSFKPYLSRTPDHSEVMDPQVIADFEATITRIKENISEAKLLETNDFKIVESTNLRVLLSGTWREFTRQPHVCHMQAFRQVLSPFGVIHCPARRGSPDAVIAPKYGYIKDELENTERGLSRILKEFDPSVACSEVTCLYQPTNAALERFIELGINPSSLEEVPGEDFFL